jgi:hypothetical protein
LQTWADFAGDGRPRELGSIVSGDHVVSVAAHLGLEANESLLMTAARAGWRQWCVDDPTLAVTPELDDLPTWTRQAAGTDKDAVLGKVAALTAYDCKAAVVLAWLLLPGASRIAAELSDLHPDIDGLVAGQLWIEVSDAHRLKPGRVAATILARTRREVAAELSVGDLARRRDRVWAEAVGIDNGDDLSSPASGYEPLDELFGQVTDLMIDAMAANAIHVFDAWLLGALASLAAQMGVPGHRGRMGLTTPAVVDELADMVHLSPRAIRRRATTALDRLAEYVEVRESPERFAVWRAQHTDCPVTPAEEMQLVLTENNDPHFFRVRDLPPDAWAPDVSPERRPPATA